MKNLACRITKLEDQRLALPAAGPLVALSELDPTVVAVFVARNCDVNLMTLAELDTLAAELRRFTD